MKRRKSVAYLAGAAALLGASIGVAPASSSASHGGHVTALRQAASKAGWGGGGKHKRIPCSSPARLCAEVANQQFTFGDTYVGHDEPSVLFYSKKPGSGTRMQYTVKLPSDPPPDPSVQGRSYNFELRPAFWFGMAMCSDQSAPNPGLPCRPDSDSNYTPDLAKQPGMAYMEMQFYPPGWVASPFGISCDATKWCAALTVTGLAEDLLHGTGLDSSCVNALGGNDEYQNFALITKNGKSHDPANPIDSTLATYTPDPKKDLFMSSGDTLRVRMFDTGSGLRVKIKDVTSGASGFMTASGKNGFAQIKYATDPSASCNPVPYNFHPAFSSAQPQFTVPWAAHTYNIAYSDEIGHFDWCNVGPNGAQVSSFGSCPLDNGEGMPGNPWRWSDNDDFFCFPGSDALLVPVDGCEASNDNGFDGASYLPDWPDGNTNLHPTPVLFTSPVTGDGYNIQYSRAAFQTDTAAIEEAPNCFHRTGTNCTRVPLQDSGQAAQFYPFFWTSDQGKAGCWWGEGNDVPGMTKNDYGGVAQFKDLQSYVGLDPFSPGNTRSYYENYGQELPNNPCPASSKAYTAMAKR